MRKKDPRDIIGYDEPIAWPDMVRAAFLHGATLSPEDMERRRRRQRHHTVPVYLQRLFFRRGERLHAFDQETRRGFATGPPSLLCENGANTVVGEDGQLRSDVEGVFAYTDYMVSKTVNRIVEAMRRRHDQLTPERSTPDRIDLTLLEADQWERDAVALWCSQRKRNPHNPDFRHLHSKAWFGASETATEAVRKMLFNLWRVTPDRGAIAELMGERELTVGVAARHGFIVGDELANFVETTDDRSRCDRVPVIPITREVCLLWRRRPPERSGRWLQFEWLDDAFVHIVNNVTTARSRVIAGPCKAQLDRLAMKKLSATTG